ncbi:hypothetical protein V6N13_019745 [Hibiscus sabdariffa]|uniref:Uncharacterized protein n=1 Tax=Hibiscus sabdariffa TaxID=183260 RepID=A0ABR2NS02_9ROSI
MPSLSLSLELSNRELLSSNNLYSYGPRTKSEQLRERIDHVFLGSSRFPVIHSSLARFEHKPNHSLRFMAVQLSFDTWSPDGSSYGSRVSSFSLNSVPLSTRRATFVRLA